MHLGRLLTLAMTSGAIAACSAPLRGGTVAHFQGEGTDPVGDTAGVAEARVPRPADLVFARAVVTEDAIRFTVRFAPGSLDPTNTGVLILLDTDLDATTGVVSPGVGADYSVSLQAGPVREGSVARAVTDPGCSSACRYAPFQAVDIALSADEMDAVVSRSAFARFDGRFNFRVIAFASLGGGGTVTSDHLPNLPAQSIAVR
jgi:hypothetical protein